MKKFWVLILLSALFIPIKSKAFVNFQSDLEWIDKSCLDTKKCIALCSYYQVMQNTPANGVAATDYYSGIYIYYYFDGKYQVSWDKGFINGFLGTGRTVTKKGSAKTVFSDDVFISSDRYKELTGNAKCPKYAYVDTGGGSSEVCFDNGKYCAGKNGWATQFTSDKQQQYSNYDVSDDIKKYFDKWSPSEDVCTSVDNCDIDKIKNQFVEDFSTNFLYGHKIPTMISNNKSYKSGYDSIIDKYQKIKNKLVEQIKSDKTLTEKQKQEKIKSTEKKIDDATKDFEESVKENTESNNTDIDSGEDVDACNVIPDVVKTWIINILKIIRYLALALVVVLGVLDFMKAAGSGEPDAMKKAGQSFGKRLIAVIVLFLLPYLVELLLGLVDLLGADPNCVDISSY